VEAVIYLDTHVVAWLYAGRHDLLSKRVRDLIRESDLLISPMVRLELQYLYETQRVTLPADSVIEDLTRSIGLKLCPQAFSRIVDKAVTLAWTRDPFDQIIVAQAALGKSPLATKDETIHSHYPRAVWE
jgi:PIN domain nuclease of toxin-antitoxin system